MALCGEIAGEAAYRTGVRLDPGSAPLMVNLADLYRNQGLDGEAEPMLRRGVAADPGYAPAYHALGLLLAAPARLARRALRTPKGQILAPDDARYAYVYAVALNSAGKATDARCGYRKLCPTRDGL